MSALHPDSRASIPTWQSGSLWRRWNPHIHAPGTLLNDQFDGDWEGYLQAIESATPAVEVLGITDYLSIESYTAVRSKKEQGRLPNVSLLFPNVEVRLSLETEKRRAVNLHLLFSPESDDHEAQIERVLTQLTFEYKHRKYGCTSSDLAALGRAHLGTATTSEKARAEGANQFKITLDQLRDLFRGDGWISQNCIVAVAASNNDGTAGLQRDSSFSAIRQEVERFAEVIFTSTPRTRDFWLGRNATCDLRRLEEEYGGRKPCLHGCDAHCVAKTCAPDEDRYCWIKGDPTFESLRQALLEPEERVWIGPEAPSRHNASLCIDEVRPRKASWLSNRQIALNQGLVAIIGPRGSGKTALTDIVAIGAHDLSPFGLNSSFLSRASYPVDHMGPAEVELQWGDGTSEVRPLRPTSSQDDEESSSGVRYLSQQFVERLCSAEGLALELRHEIEQVIFDATDPLSRVDADSFGELANLYLSPIQRAREAAQVNIANTSSEVNAEDLLVQRIPGILKDAQDRKKRVEKTKAEMKSLLPRGQEDRIRRLADLEAALGRAANVAEKYKKTLVRLDELQKEVDTARSSSAHQLSRLMTYFQDVGLSPKQWEDFGFIRKLRARRKSFVVLILALSH
jgi:hypothetical protein